MNGDAGYTRNDLVRLLLQTVMEMPPPPEEHLLPAPAPESVSPRQLFEDYPMMAKLSPSEELIRMLKNAEII